MTARFFLYAALIAGLALGTAAYILWPKPSVRPIDVAHMDDYVFVPSQDAAEFTLIDTTVDEVAGIVTLPFTPETLLVSDELGLVIFSNAASRSIGIYDMAARSVGAVIDLPFAPRIAVLSPEGYMVGLADPESDRIGVVMLNDNTLHAVVEGVEAPDNLTFSDDGALLYVTEDVSAEVKVIDVAQGKVVDVIRMSLTDDDAGPANPRALSAVTRTPNGRYGVCVSESGGGMAVLNFSDSTEMKVLRLGREPSRPYTTADGRLMLIANNGDRTISLVDTEDFGLIATLPGVAGVSGINTGFFETVGFVVSESEDKAVVLDLMEMKVTGEIALDSRPGPGVVDSRGLRMYVALSGSDALAVVDVQQGEVVKRISDVGHRPRGATMSQTNNYCH